jgi:dTDP-4-amino-4,6-dideoxygalactose transaminase
VTWRRQLPAYSPLPLRAVLAGAGGALAGRGDAPRPVEALLAHQFGADAVLLTDSGTGALALAIRSCLDTAPGSAVAIPAYGCYDLATAADGAGSPVVVYDVDPATLAPDLDSLRRAVGRGARAVVLVHLYGVPVDPEPVRAATAGSGAWLIEDAAQGTGATLRGRPLGSFGDLTVLSFGRGKGNTGGRGGALLSPAAAGVDLVARARGRVQGGARGVREVVQLGAQWLLGRPSLYVLPASLPFLQLGETVYHRPAAVRALSAVAAKALEVTWPLREREATTRRAHAARLLARGANGLAPVAVPSGAEAGYLRLPFMASAAARAEAATSRARALGIMPGYPAALSDLPGFGDRVLNLNESLPGARLLAERLVTLPVHSLLSERDLTALEAWAAARRS